MKEYAEKFYKSTAWQNCRDAYASSKHYLCEECMKKGIYTPGEIVHHRIHISPSNIDDPSITLSWDNLQLLCRSCHERVHRQRDKRYKVDDKGHVTILED